VLLLTSKDSAGAVSRAMKVEKRNLPSPKTKGGQEVVLEGLNLVFTRGITGNLNAALCERGPPLGEQAGDETKKKTHQRKKIRIKRKP